MRISLLHKPGRQNHCPGRYFLQQSVYFFAFTRTHGTKLRKIINYLVVSLFFLSHRLAEFIAELHRVFSETPRNTLRNSARNVLKKLRNRYLRFAFALPGGYSENY